MSKRIPKIYSSETEKMVYDAAYYENHVKYYERGIPNFIQYLKDNFDFESIADIGCGAGAFTSPLQIEKKVYGFDFSIGSKEVTFLTKENLYEADLTIENSTKIAQNVDLVISLEVYEHIRAEFEKIYLNNVFGLNAKYVIISCAPEGQWGRHHVNCKSIEEVIKTVEENYSQYKLNEEKTTNFKKIKALASFYKRNTLVFVKE
jgi:SAM-dependent methyltransferase